MGKHKKNNWGKMWITQSMLHNTESKTEKVESKTCCMENEVRHLKWKNHVGI